MGGGITTESFFLGQPPPLALFRNSAPVSLFMSQCARNPLVKIIMAKRTSKDMVIRISHSQHPNLSMKKNSPKPDRQPNAVTPPPTALPAESCKPPTLRNLFAIDPRSLALFRIAIGLLLLADLLVRATDLTAMYTDDGMFPRAVIHHHFTSIWIWSFHFGSGTWAFQAVLFGIAAVLALALLVGFKTVLRGI